jgi:HlyD family secretion protein
MKVSALGVEEQRTNVILKFNDAAMAETLGHDFRVDARVIIEEQTAVVRLPLGALFRHGEGWATYRVVDEHAELTPLATGIADETHRVITQGVSAGDTVLLFPGNAVADGQHVVARRVD